MVNLNGWKGPRVVVREQVHFVLICQYWVHPSQLLRLNQSNSDGSQNEVNENNSFNDSDKENVKNLAIKQHKDENSNNHHQLIYSLFKLHRTVYARCNRC